MKDLVWLLGLLVQFDFSHGIASCRDDSKSPPWVNCDYGCCGDYPYHTCCSTGWSVGAIVGAAVGGFVFMALIITLCCCFISKFCTQTGKSGHVTAPVMTVRSAVNPSVSGYPPQQGYPSPYQGHLNQGYNNHISHPPPPAYNQLSFDPPTYDIQPSAPTFPSNGSTSFAAEEKQHGFEHPPHPHVVNKDLVTEYYH